MTRKELESGSIFIEKKPAKHTTKLEKVERLSFRTHFETSDKAPYKRRNYTYVYFYVCTGQYYRAANSTEDRPLYLDGLVGCMKLTAFKAKYRILS